MAELRGFNNNGLLNIKNVFFPEEIDPPCPTGQLAIKERVIVRTPADLCDIKVTGETQLGAHALKLCLLERLMFQAQADLIQGL